MTKEKYKSKRNFLHELPIKESRKPRQALRLKRKKPHAAELAVEERSCFWRIGPKRKEKKGRFPKTSYCRMGELGEGGRILKDPLP